MSEKQGLAIFEKYVSVWVALSIVSGITIGRLLPIVPTVLKQAEVAHVSIPVAILIWLMIYPMMLRVDLSSLKNVGKRPKGLILTLAVNWAIKPFAMAGIVLCSSSCSFEGSFHNRSRPSTTPEPSCSEWLCARRWCSCGVTSLEGTQPTRWCK